MRLLYSIQAEWLKTRKSAAQWLCLAGGFFVPLIFLIGFIKNGNNIVGYAQGKAWETHFMQCWRIMAQFLFPMGIILAISLIAQLEFRNNAWKQLHTTPQTFANIFIAKYAVIIFMLLEYFIYFNIGILISGAIPSLLFSSALPHESFPLLFFIKWNIKIFILFLPVSALQYLLSLQLKNFMLPIGIGLFGLIGTLIGASSWKYIWLSPFCYGARPPGLSFHYPFNGYLMAGAYFALLIGLGFFLYQRKKEKG
jgi:hypothetical protein